MSQIKRQTLECDSQKNDNDIITLIEQNDDEVESQELKTKNLTYLQKKNMYEQQDQYLDKPKTQQAKNMMGLVTSLCYTLTAVGMTLINKAIWYLTYKVNLRLAIQWIPVTILFVLMLSTSGFALQYLPVPIVTVFKNVGLCLTAFGDYLFFGSQHSSIIKFSIFLMLLGGFLAAITDVMFTLEGYIWMILEEFEMVFYNTMLSVPFFVLLSVMDDEWTGALAFQYYGDSSFQILWCVGGIMSVAISLSSFMCMNYAGPTAFAIVGGFNKVPLTILGYILFSVPVELKNLISISFSMAAGFLYSKAKFDENRQKK